jgi:lichenan operon transcriptional antiterminator
MIIEYILKDPVIKMSYKRQKDLFIYLLNSDIGLSGNELAKIFNVSSRTIRSDIKFLNELIKPYGINICSSSKKGYFILKEHRKIGFTIVEEVFTKENSISKIPNTPSERFAFILYKLIFAENYITMQEFADMLFASKTTIYLDVKNIIKVLDRFSKLKLEISPIKGLKLNGDERSKRLLMSNIFRREKVNKDLILSKSFYYAFGREDPNLNREMLFLYNTIINVLNKYGYILTDADLSLLVKDILVSIKRIQLGFTIREKAGEELDLTIAKALQKEVEAHFNILMNDKELEYFQQSFNSKRLLNVTNDNYVLKQEAESIVDEFVNDVLNKFNIDFRENEVFKNNLALHLNPMIERIRDNNFEDNPLKNQIKTNYPLAYEISMLMVPIINKRLNIIINESEISYIALYVSAALDELSYKINIAIVCGSGLGTAQLIRNKILSYFNYQINIIGCYPVYKLDNILRGEYGKVDLIISTIPLNVGGNIPTIQVNPLINQNDLFKIKQYIDFKGTNPKERMGIFFRKGLFKYFDEDIDYFSAILELCRMLEAEEFIDNSQVFYKSAIKREKLFSTILDEMVAIPHPMESMSKTTVVAVGIFKNPIIYCGKKVNMIFLLAINAKEDEKLKVLYKMIQGILEDEEIIRKLSKARDINDFIESIE